MALEKGAWTPQVKMAKLNVPQEGCPKCRTSQTDSLLESQPLSPVVWIENMAKVRINGESCMALHNNGVLINMITLIFVEEHSLNIGPLTDLVGG